MRTTPPPLARLVAGALLALTLSACGSTRIFHADFDADTPGRLPAENPPGAPAGDLIWTSAGSASTRVLAVADGAPFSNKSLRYFNADVPAYQRFVGFFSGPATIADDQTFYAYWTGSINLDPRGSSLRVWLGDSHFGTIAGLRFKDGKVEAEGPRAPGAPDAFQEIGRYSQTGTHFVLLTVEKRTATYRVSIIQRGEPNVTSGPLPVVDRAAMATRRPTLYLHYPDAASGSGSYGLDDVTISEKRPATPTGG